MKNLSEMGRLFNTSELGKGKHTKFYDVNNAPIKVYGVIRENDHFCRVPQEIAKTVSANVEKLAGDSAGGRIRFQTDSPYVALYVQMIRHCHMPHFTFCGSCGFDIYDESAEQYSHLGTFQPPMDDDVYEYTRMVEFKFPKYRDIVINMPLYSEIRNVYVGIEEGSILKAPKPYQYETPVVYYGSSITQGGCASRPGNSYQAIISRKLNCDYINLGFSGSGKAEKEMAAYISGLKMSAFVFDYDHNAPTVEYLKATHKPMFDTIRKANPDLPIILVSCPDRRDLDQIEGRLKVIQETYEAALNAGDQNVYFINGQEIHNLIDPDITTVDGIHQTDFGFYCMAEVIGKVVKKVLTQ